MTAVSRRSLVAALGRVRRQRDQAIEMAARYKIALEEARQAYAELMRGLDEVKAGLAENRELARRYGMIDAADKCERDLAEPLQ
jgi:uncharacterized coiled-coil DUF342 family protein